MPNEGITHYPDASGVIEESVCQFRYVKRNGEKVLQQGYLQTDTWYPNRGFKTSQRLVWRDVPTEEE